MLVFAIACGRSGLGRAPVDGVAALEGPVPQLSTFAVDCDVDAGAWKLTAEATTWTGGAVSRWTRDLQYIEQHEVPVTASAPDRGREELVLQLGIVSDWRSQTSGRSTVFTCAEVPTVTLDVRSTAGDVVACAVVGPRAEEILPLPELGCGEGDTAAGGSGASGAAR